MKQYHQLVMVLVTAVLVACSVNGANSQIGISTKIYDATDSVLISTVTNEPSETLLPLPTMTRTISTPMPIPSLPLVNNKYFNFQDFFFHSGNAPECTLPCWQGLLIGESGPEDLQNALNNTFGFDKSVTFASGTSSNLGLEAIDMDVAKVPELYAVNHMWDVGGTNFQNFSFAAGFEKATDKLAVLGFHWETTDSNKFEVAMSPQIVIKELGKPSEALAGIIGSPGDTGIIRLMLIYDQGLIFEFHNETPIISTYTDSSHSTFQESILKYCLGNTKTTTDGFIEITGNVYMLPQFSNGLEDLVATQAAVLSKDLALRHIGPIEKIFDTTLDEITQMSVAQENPCLESKNLLGK